MLQEHQGAAPRRVTDCWAGSSNDYPLQKKNQRGRKVEVRKENTIFSITMYFFVLLCVLHTEDTEVNKTDRNPYPCVAYSGERDRIMC